MTAESPQLTLGLLSALEECWRRQAVPLAGALKPGLRDDKMDALVAPLGLRLPPELRLWWGWHNGVQEGVVLDMVGSGWGFMTLEVAVQRTRSERDYCQVSDMFCSLPTDEPIESHFGEESSYWSDCLLTFSENMVQQQLAVDCRSPNGLCPVYRLDVVDRAFDPPVAGSIGELVSWFIAALDDGSMNFDPGAGRWRYDFERMSPELRHMHQHIL